MKTPRLSLRSFQRASVHALIAQAEAEELLRPGTASYKIGAPPPLEEQPHWTTHSGQMVSKVLDFICWALVAGVSIGVLWLFVVAVLLSPGQIGQ
jgi:hypothetical protein